MPTSNSRISLQLAHIKLKGFKSIEDLETTLQPGLNILIGKNGAGKSNFFQCVNMVSASIFSLTGVSLKSAEFLFSAEDGVAYRYEITKINQRNFEDETLMPGYRQLVENNVKVVFDSSVDEVTFFTLNGKKYLPPQNIGILFQRLKLVYRRTNYIGFGYPEKLLGLTEPISMQIPFDFEEFWNTSIGIPLLNDAVMELESGLHVEHDLLTPDSENDFEEDWADLLEGMTAEKFMKLSTLDAQTIENLRKFSPIQDVKFNKNITFYRLDRELVIDNIRLDFFVNDNWLPWSQLSDGTKRLFIIITEISLSYKRLILLEEPELGIHPHQFNLLMQFLKEQSYDHQIIISTHSPKALDILDEDELDRILIATYEKGSGTKIKHLNDNQKKKAIRYVNEVGYLSDYWLMSDLDS